MKNLFCYLNGFTWLLAAVLNCLASFSGNAALTVMDTKYHPDLMFQEFDCYWDGGQYPNFCPTNFAGATVYVYVKNTGAGSVTISDATLAGHSLATVIKRSTASWNPNNLNSIYFYWDNPPADILAAGEPVWWKADPPTVPAGGVGQVAVRLRYIPTTPDVTVGVVSPAGTITANISVDANAPQIQSIAFSEDRTKVYLHWRRTSSGGGSAVPSSVYLDGTNVTSLTTSVGDSSLGIAASVINLTNALSHFSFHVYQGVYADGKSAPAGQRAWTNKFIYATYGTFDTVTAEQWLDEASDHGFNNVQMNLGLMGNYMGTAAGRADMLAHGYGYTILDPGKLNPIDPDMWFLNDEPELNEHNNYESFCGTGYRIPCNYDKFAGTMAILESVEHAAELRSHRPNVPMTVNLDGGLQPWSFYNWGPSVDILQTDNYYEPRMRNAYENDANKIPLYNNSRFTYAIGRTITAAGEPNPAHHLLYSTAKLGWPYPAWQSKRFEVYYTLAGGTRAGIGYWWLQGGYGMNNTDPDSQLLWKEVGLCGNEIKTVRDLIIKSTPLDDLSITPSPKVWARAVSSGTDSMILYVVNDNYVNAANGYCYVTNVANAAVTLTPPEWMQGPMAFEVTAGGLKPVSMTPTNGNQLRFNLGTLTLTRMIVLTKDAQVPLATQQRYLSVVRPGVCNMAPAYCTNSAPAIVVQPQSQVVLANSNATFVVTATGIPAPTYQWRYNGGNLSGATSATYTRADAQVSDNGGYSVVVSNSLGAVTSVVASLTVSTNGFPPGILTSPQSQSVEIGADATFFVTATGNEPLSYQWRFNHANIAGATTNSYTRTNAQVSNSGSYDVVIANGSGSITSAPATLLVTFPCPPTSLLNASFEGGNSGGVATSWASYQRAPNPTTVWSIQTASPPSGGGAQYQQIANTSSTGGGGVRQDITGCVVGATYSIGGWFRGNSANSTVTVKVSPAASTSWSTATNLTPAATMNGASWIAFSGTVVATGTNMTLWLDGQTGGTGQNNTACFDVIVLTCEGMPAQPPIIIQHPLNQSVELGESASFTMQAYGSDPLSYRWQKNDTNLNDGGHYSGVLTPTLAITGADNNDVASYRCVVTNAYGSTNSAAATLTVTNASTPPSITQQPVNQGVLVGGTANFTVGASGTGTLYYRWQKNSVNLNDGGHYSGVLTPTLTITGADNSDVANYRCAVTNNYGSTNSVAASLTVTQASFACISIANADFEGGFSVAGGGYIATNWTEWEATAGVAIGYDETGIVHGGAHSQRIRVSSTGATSGGVYQRVPATPGALYSISVWVYADTALTSCYLGVDPAGGTNASSGVVWSTATTNVAWVQKTWIGTATANYITVFYKVATPDNVKRNGYFDDATPSGSGGALQLTAQRNGQDLILSWPECPAAHLERADSLVSPVGWTPATNQVNLVNGQKTVTLVTTGNTGFFRLVAE